MDRDVLTACLLILLLGIGCEGGIESGSDGGSGSEDPADPDSATFSPAGASASIALNAAVTVTFSATITEPSDWTSVLTLKKDGAGDSLCTAVNYDSVSRVATCVHSELDGSRNYTAALSGLSGVTDATATFTTGPEIVVTMGKTSVASTYSGNDVTLTFSFAGAVPSDWPLTAQVTDPDGTVLTVSGCVFNAGRTSYSCTVSGIDGCTTFSDYTVAVTGTGGFTTTFNSADDEFESDGPLTHNCWSRELSAAGGASVTVTEDATLSMVLTQGGAGSVNAALNKSFSGISDIAVLTHISSVSRPQGMPAEISTALAEGTTGHTLVFDVTQTVGNINTWFIGINPDGTQQYGAQPIEGGELGATKGSNGPFHVCMVRHSNTIRTYLSTDGSSYTRLSADNVTDWGVIGINAIVEPSASWASMSRLKGGNQAANTTLSGKFGYIRYKTTGITGTSSADCPAF